MQGLVQCLTELTRTRLNSLVHCLVQCLTKLTSKYFSEDCLGVEHAEEVEKGKWKLVPVKLNLISLHQPQLNEVEKGKWKLVHVK